MVLEIINKRWSPRAFSTKPVEVEKLHRIFNAAQRSPSCSNEQPWRFLVGIKEKGDTWNKIFNTLTEPNQRWAVHAPILVVIVAKKDFTKTAKANHYYLYDSGQSAAYMTIQATAENLYVHQMGGFDPVKISKTFNINNNYEPITAIAIGYKGDAAILPEEMREREQQVMIRKELSEIIFKDWNSPFDFH